MKINLDSEEQTLLDSVEAEEWQSKGDIKNRVIELQACLKEEKQAVSVHLSENDLYELKRKGLENGITYQHIIQMLVHQYTSNKIHLDM